MKITMKPIAVAVAMVIAFSAAAQARLSWQEMW